ncbi:hypothetical protein BUALT_Bualt10G0113900 [Buddleja alternifolia]|uniref:Uncharacterized protein n=1 Tax=Buddleja alternifolia TaxID=168488 RepID=A0AAV6WX39_9LAMI|nr:hypothetical protein BUALT_Bualt10G0113900 [Buddleja alternifolia]
MQVLRVLSLPTSRHHLAGSCRYQQRERNNKMETPTNYGSWPRQRPRRRGDRSKRERLDDVFIPTSGDSISLLHVHGVLKNPNISEIDREVAISRTLRTINPIHGIREKALTARN